MLRTFIKLHFVVNDNEPLDESLLGSICRYLAAVVRFGCDFLILQIRGAKININKDENELKIVFAQLWFFLDLAAKSLAQTIVHRKLFLVRL